MKTKVVFRKSSGEVTAVFPFTPHDHNKLYAVCYAFVGQHSMCSDSWVTRHTKPAKPEEYAPLKKELERIGYELEILTRYPANAFKGRKEGR